MENGGPLKDAGRHKQLPRYHRGSRECVNQDTTRDNKQQLGIEHAYQLTANANPFVCIYN